MSDIGLPTGDSAGTHTQRFSLDSTSIHVGKRQTINRRVKHLLRPMVTAIKKNKPWKVMLFKGGVGVELLNRAIMIYHAEKGPVYKGFIKIRKSF